MGLSARAHECAMPKTDQIDATGYKAAKSRVAPCHIGGMMIVRSDIAHAFSPRGAAQKGIAYAASQTMAWLEDNVHDKQAARRITPQYRQY